MRMLSRLFGMLALACVMACGSVSTGCHITNVTYIETDGITPSQLASEAADVTVLVETDHGSGSGVVLDLGTGQGLYVLTAAHVVWDEGGIDENGQPTPPGPRPAGVFKTGATPFVDDTTLVFLSGEPDLALLKLNHLVFPGYSKIASGPPVLYQRCWASGHPHRLLNTTVTDGRIEALYEGGFTRYSANTTFGNSGGPLFTLEKGHLVVTSIVQRVEVEGMGVAVTHLGFGATLDTINKFLAEVANMTSKPNANGGRK